MALALLLPAVLGPATIALAAIYWWAQRRAAEKSNAAWRIRRRELIFDDPPRVLGLCSTRAACGLMAQPASSSSRSVRTFELPLRVVKRSGRLSPGSKGLCLGAALPTRAHSYKPTQRWATDPLELVAGCDNGVQGRAATGRWCRPRIVRPGVSPRTRPRTNRRSRTHPRTHSLLWPRCAGHAGKDRQCAQVVAMA